MLRLASLLLKLECLSVEILILWAKTVTGLLNAGLGLDKWNTKLQFSASFSTMIY